MRIKNNKLKLLIIVLILFLCPFLAGIKSTLGIYKSNLNTTINLTVLDPSTNYVVTLDLNYGTNNTTTVLKAYNEQMGNDLYTPTRTGYNFIGWYDSSNNKVYSDVHITGTTTFHAEWREIVCKQTTAGNLNTETCAGNNGCRTGNTGYSSTNTLITYGSLYGIDSPRDGDAFDCDIDYDGIYDETDNGKHIHRFYFVREKENQGSENTAVLIYYTSYDSTHGRVDTQSIGSNYNSIGSDYYNTALTWLPTSSTTGWSNPGLIDFDGNNGKITRFLSVADLKAVCGPLNPDGSSPSGYFTDCFNDSDDPNDPNWYMFENSRFQSSGLARAGIWLEYDGVHYYRIQTSTLAVSTYAAQNGGSNMARPVIEVPMSALEGYVDADKYSISFVTHEGSPVTQIYKRFDGEEIGSLPTTTRDHYTFDGWYATYDSSTGTYSDLVTASTVVHGDMTLHAKWTAKPTCTVTLELDGGTGVSSPVIVDIGDFYEPDTPTKADSSFAGWYTDYPPTTPYDSTVAISTATLTLYAKWTTANYVATVEGVGSYESLAEAISHVPTGSTKTRVTLLKNITLTDEIIIPNNKWVELDGGSYTISGSDISITNNGKLDIISGTITSTATTTNTIITNVRGATLNISDGTINANGNVASKANMIISNSSGATVNISGGTLNNNSTAGSTDHLIATNNGTFNITGGTLNTYGQSASINNNAGTLTMSGGEIHAHGTTKAQAVYIAGGTVNIRDSAYLTNVSQYDTASSRPTVDNNGGTLNITGGTIVSEQHAAVETRKADKITRIGTDDDAIDITTPVLRGKSYGSITTAGTVYVYDGIFESLNNTSAVSGATTTPAGINYTNSTIDVSGVTYYSTYLFAPYVTVTFDANGGTVEGQSTYDVIVDNGNSIGGDMPTNVIRANYYFDGWYDSNNVVLTSSTPITMNKTVHAKWVQDFTNGTVPSSLNVEITRTNNIGITGTDLEDVTYTSNNPSVVTVDADGVVTGVTIGSTTITITGTKSGSTSTVTVNVTPLMRHIVFLDSDGETELFTRDVENNTSLDVNMPGNPTDTDYIFNGWYINGDSLQPFTSSTTVTGDITVIANWKEKVTYATLSTSPDPFHLVIGNTGQITLSATTQGDTIEPCTYTSSDPTVATVNSSGLVTTQDVGTTNITITGTLSGATRTVEVRVANTTSTVSFYDGSTLYTSREVNTGSSVGANMPNDPTKQNHIFAGWYVDGNILTPFTSSTAVTGGDVNVYAKWKETISIATLPASPMTIFIGTNQEVLVTPTNEDFVEDYTLSSSNTNYVEVSNNRIYGVELGTVTLTITGVNSNVSRTITVEVINSYSVTFDPDNGDPETTIHVEIGSTIDASGESLPNNPTKSGYVFDDWYLYDEGNATLTDTRLDTTATVSSDIIYKAKWVSTTYYAVTYTANGPVYSTTLQNAFNAAPTTGVATEVKLLQDITNPVGYTRVLEGRSIILNGGSFTVTAGSSTTNRMIYNEAGTLRIISGTYLCGEDTLATLQNAAGKTMYIDGGWIEQTNTDTTKARGAIYNEGTVVISGGTLKSSAPQRAVVQNAKTGASITMTGGTVIQTVVSNMGALHNEKTGTSITITGGTVTSVGNAVQAIAGSTLVIGTDDNDNSYDATSPVIQGDQYGVSSAVNYSVYDGIIKGKTAAVNDESKITGTETGTTKKNGTEGLYHTLYYEEPAPVQKYRINFYTNGGTGVASYVDYDLNVQITAADLPTPTKGIYTFDGWYTDVGLNTAFATFTPTTAGSTDCYASWSYASSTTPVSHIVTSDAMTYYFNNISSWASADSQIAVNQDSDLSNDNHSTFTSNMYANFTNYSCSECESPNGQANQNSCNSPSTGTYCDKPQGYDTGVNAELDVYLYVNGAKSGSKLNGSSAGNYITVTNGVIYNMIPGNTYYWELHSDANVYGVVSATKNATHYRRTLNTSVRNLRDLGGMSVSYTVNGVTTNGTIKYGRLYRGAQIASGTTGVNELKKLGITREIDLRQNGDGNSGQTKFETSNYDVSTSDTSYLNCRHFNNSNEYCFANPTTYSTDGFLDVKITNYQINPVANTYFTTAYSNNFDDLKAAMKAVMRQIVNHETVFFHCTIGTDRTGTIAYFLEGLLGVSEEDRLRDYEMTYYFGLTNRSRFHNNLSTSSINPRFYAMYKSYPTVADIEAFYKTHPQSDDDSLLAAFRQEMIE